MASAETKVEDTNPANQPNGGSGSGVTTGNPGEMTNPNMQNQLAALLQQQQQQQQQNSFANQLNPGLQGFANPQMALLQQQLMAQQARQMAMNGGLGNLAGLMNLGGINPQLLNVLAQQQMMQPAMMQSAPGNLASQNQGNFGSVPTMIDTSAGKKQGQDSASSSVSNHKPKKKKAAKASKAAKHVIDEEPLDRPKRPLRYVANSETFRFPRKRVRGVVWQTESFSTFSSQCLQPLLQGSTPQAPWSGQRSSGRSRAAKEQDWLCRNGQGM